MKSTDGDNVGGDEFWVFVYAHIIWISYRLGLIDWETGTPAELDLRIDGDLSKCDIKSLTLSDPTMNSSETYYANRSNFFPNTGTARWECGPQEILFFQSRVGKQIDVIIEVEKKKKGPACIHNGAGARSAYGNCCKCECRWPIVKPRLSYTRINHHWCGTTKKLPHSTAGDFITRKRAANMCPKFGLSGFKKPALSNTANCGRCPGLGFKGKGTF